MQQIFDGNNKFKNLHEAVDFLTKHFDEQEQNHTEKEEVIKSLREDVTNITNKKNKSSHVMDK